MDIEQYISSHFEESFKLYFLISYAHSIIDTYIILNYGCAYDNLIPYMFILTLYPYFLLFTAYVRRYMPMLIVFYHVCFGIYGIIVIFMNNSILILHDLNIQYFLYRAMYMLFSSYFMYTFNEVMIKNEEGNGHNIIDLKNII